MNPTHISLLALLISILSFLFTIWSRRGATKVRVAEKLTQARLAIADVIVTVENQLTLTVGPKAMGLPTNRARWDNVLEKSNEIRAKLSDSSWPANNDSLVRLEDISGDIMEVLKETQSLIQMLRKRPEVD